MDILHILRGHELTPRFPAFPLLPAGWNIMLGWFLLTLLLGLLLPGEVVLGCAVPRVDASTGKATSFRLPYVMSGHLQFWLLLTGV